MSAGLDDVTRLHVEKAVEALAEEFGETASRDEIESLMNDSLRQLVRDAEVNDFVATLARRFTRERLMAQGHRSLVTGAGAVTPAVLFLGLHDTGRGQMAAALAQQRSEGRIVVHSAGNDPTATVDPAVQEVMSEAGIDLSEAYAKPVSQEVLGAVDVVVTLGRTVELVDLPETARHEDWRVGDPAGAPVDEVRRVRDDIARRVDELLAELLPS